jgi:hypothetical protein
LTFYALHYLNEFRPQYECGFGSFIIKDSIVNKFSSYSHLGLCMGMLVVYAITWTFIKIRKSPFSCPNPQCQILANSSSKKIIKSLSIITIIVALTWPTSVTIQTIVGFYPDSKAAKLLLNYSVVMINTGIATNYFIFYAFRYDF